MLKIAIFDSGFGGELFADELQEKLDVVEVVRVIDWRNAGIILKDKKAAREKTEAALQPYIGKVDLIILANHFVTATSLGYFNKKYKDQKFLGFELKHPGTFLDRNTVILATEALAKTLTFHNFIFKLKRKTKVICLDSWPAKIDDGEITINEIEGALIAETLAKSFIPEEIILACGQFNDIKDEIRSVFGKNVKIYDSFDDTMREACRILKLRGGIGKKK